jgi:hypothetical protein
VTPKRKPSRARRRRGLPKKKSVLEKIPFVAKGGAKFTILRTTEKDSYDPPFKTLKKTRRKPRGSE